MKILVCKGQAGELYFYDKDHKENYLTVPFIGEIELNIKKPEVWEEQTAYPVMTSINSEIRYQVPKGARNVRVIYETKK